MAANSNSRKLQVLRKSASHQVIRALYRDVRGIEICIREKDSIDLMRLGEGDKSLTYGEIVSESFEMILRDAIAAVGAGAGSQGEKGAARGQQGLVFYDLGSGTGKAVLTALLCCPLVTRAVGLEIVPSLHAAAEHVVEKLRQAMEAAGAAALAAPRTRLVPASLRPAAAAAAPPPPKGSGGGGGGGLSTADLLAAVVCELRRLEAASTATATTTDTATAATTEARLANAVCLSVGQKPFKAAFAKGGFRKFLLAHRDTFELRGPTGGGGGGDEGEVGGKGGDKGGQSTVHLRSSGAVLKSESGVEGEREGETEGGAGTDLPPVPLATPEKTTPEKTAPEPSADQLLAVLQQPHVSSALSPMGQAQLEVADIFLRQPAWYGEADVAYCSSLLFSDAQLRRLCEQVLCMRRGAVFICLKPLPLRAEEGEAARVRLLGQSFFQMSWQKALVYMYQLQ